MAPSLPIEIWHMIFSHFVSRPLRLEVTNWQDGRPDINVSSCFSAGRASTRRFLDAFVTEDRFIQGFCHTAIRFLMTHTYTVWVIRIPLHRDSSTGIWYSEPYMKVDLKAIEHLAMLEDVFKVHVHAIQVEPDSVVHQQIRTPWSKSRIRRRRNRVDDCHAKVHEHQNTRLQPFYC